MVGPGGQGCGTGDQATSEQVPAPLRDRALLGKRQPLQRAFSWPGGKPKVTTAVPAPRIFAGIMELTHLVPVKQREKIPKWARAPQCLLTKLLRLWRKYLDLEIGYQFSAFNQETQHFHQTRRS